MAFKDKAKEREYINNWKKEARRKRGLQKQGRKPLTEEEKNIAKEKRKEWEVEYNKTHSWAHRPIVDRLITNAKKRAKEKQINFNITKEDIIIPEFCPYLGVKLEDSSNRYLDRSNVASLDRIIPELGYVKGNIEVISNLANTMKSNASKEQLIQFALKVLEKFNDSKTT